MRSHSSYSSQAYPTANMNDRHAEALRQFNADIFKRNVLTDVEVHVGGRVFKSHRSVLACFSPFLKRKLLSLDGKPLSKKVHVPNIDQKEFDVLLQYMYTGDLKLNCNNFLEVYKAANVLEMKEVIQECLQIFNSKDEIRSYFYIFVTAKKMGIEAMWMRSYRLLIHRFEETVCAHEFLELDINSVVELLTAQNIGARSEVIVFLAALNWLNYDYPGRREFAVSVMRCVRFSSMTMDEVVACYHPPFLPELLDIPEIVTLLYRATCYITAKFLGQESWFQNYGCQKRNLAFEHLPMELWHRRDTTGTPNVDFPSNLADKKSPGDLLALSSLRESVGLGKELDSGYSLDRIILQQGQTENQGRRVSNVYPAERDENTQRPYHNAKGSQPLEVKGPGNFTASGFHDKALHQDRIGTVTNTFHHEKTASNNPLHAANIREKSDPAGNRESIHQQILRQENNISHNRNEFYNATREENRRSLMSEQYNKNSNIKKSVEPGSKVPMKEFPVQTDSFDVSRPLPKPEQHFTNPRKASIFPNQNYNPGTTIPQRNQSNTPTSLQYKESEKFHPHLRSEQQDISSKSNVPADHQPPKPSTRDMGSGKSASEQETHDFSMQYIQENTVPKKPPGKDISCGESRSMTAVDSHSNQKFDNGAQKEYQSTDSQVGDASLEEVRKESLGFVLSPASSVKGSEKLQKPCILVTGGLNPKSIRTLGIGGAVLNFIPSKNKWLRYNSLPEARHNHCAVFWNNQLYVIGGCDPMETLHRNRYSAKSSCFKLDIGSQQWTEIEKMKFKRYDHAAVVLEGFIFVIGGQDDGERLLKTIEVFDSKRNKWKLLSSDMCCGRKAMGAAAFSSKIWIAGGLIQPDKDIYFQVVSHVDCYDPVLKRWLFKVSCLPSPRFYISLTAWNGHLVCVGGMRQDSSEKMYPTDEVWYYDETARHWIGGPSLPVPRLGCGAVSFDNTLYVIGGFNPESDLHTRNVNYLLQDTGSWETAAPLPSQLFGSSIVSSLAY